MPVTIRRRDLLQAALAAASGGFARSAMAGRGERRIRLSFPTSIDCLDPAQTSSTLPNYLIGHTVLDPLISIDASTGKPVSRVLADWRPEEGGAIWYLRLRRGIRWHQTPWFTPTREANAEDLLYSLRRPLLNPAHFVARPQLAMIREADAVSVSTVRIRLGHPMPDFVEQLQCPSLVLMSAEYARQFGPDQAELALRLAPVGTGPYRVMQIDPGREGHRSALPVMTLYPHPGHPGSAGAEAIDVHVDGGVDAQWQWLALRTGQRDFAEIQQVRMRHPASGALGFIRSDGDEYSFYLRLASDRGAFSRAVVRRAFADSIDTDWLGQLLLGDQHAPALPRTAVATRHAGARQAAERLAVAGVTLPVPVQLHTWATSFGHSRLVQAAFRSVLAHSVFELVPGDAPTPSEAGQCHLFGCMVDVKGPLGLAQTIELLDRYGQVPSGFSPLSTDLRQIEADGAGAPDADRARLRASAAAQLLSARSDVIPLWRTPWVAGYSRPLQTSMRGTALPGMPLQRMRWAL